MPATGLKDIVLQCGDVAGALPAAHQCYLNIDVPEYESFEVFAIKLE
jgi:hypothetical protein